MTRTELIAQIRRKKSFLCVGLDTDPSKLPAGVDMLTFNKAIIDATRDYCVAYKPNLAFYEVLGTEGWRVLEETIRYIGASHFIIADAKRGDIGNTSTYYARTFFETLACDSVTVAPYMGRDSVEPFLQFPGKWAIVLALTSNPGASDFELKDIAGEPVYTHVLRAVASWGTAENTMFVVGATRPEMLAEVRRIVPDHFLLVPGVGAQGGSLSEVIRYGMNADVGLLVNASRTILYASSGADYAEAAGAEAARMQSEMAAYC
ncbi:MAG: orotidine-5'-phosphate decarboxylase [Flavobacteriales bacterium]|jgi:orotidine-5'-phosphate decarboxylase